MQDACSFLVRQAIPPSAGKEKGRIGPRIVIFNPSPYARGGLCEMEIDMPGEEPTEGLRMVDGSGHEIVPHVKFLHASSPSLDWLVCRPMPTRHYRVQFEIDSIQPMSWLDLEVVRSDIPARTSSSLASAGNVLENDFLKATVRDDGRIDLLHKATGREYPGLHYFEDVGDRGDPWNFKPVGDPIVPEGPAGVRLVENTPLRATIQIETRMELPRPRPESAPQGTVDRGEVVMTSRISLTRTGRRLDVETTIENGCRDHRLRVCFPTGISTETTYAGGQFHVDERTTHLPDMSDWIEPVDGYPNFGFAGLCDGTVGLAALNIGLPEYFVAGEQHDTLTLTLLRATQLKR